MGINWLQKTARIEIMYHGTSDALSSRILSEGLVPGRALVWDEERTKGDNRSRASYGGIYMSNNFMIAYSAATTATDQFGGKRMIVMCQLELRTQSILLDEDKLLDARLAIDSAMGVSANSWWYGQWVQNGFYDIDNVVDKYLEFISKNWKTNEPNYGFEDMRQGEAIKSLIKDYIIATVMREIAIEIERERHSPNSWKNLTYKFPEFAEMTLSQAEANYRHAANELMNKTRFMTNAPSDFIHNIRVIEPISFSGKNKILLIVRIDERSYDIEILYENSFQAISMLIKDIKKSLGGGLRVRDKDGNIYFDQVKTI